MSDPPKKTKGPEFRENQQAVGAFELRRKSMTGKQVLTIPPPPEVPKAPAKKAKKIE